MSDDQDPWTAEIEDPLGRGFRIPVNGHPAGMVPQGVVPSVKCRARSSRTGKPCGRYAIVGGTVCPFHGGSAPQVKAAAQRRLQEMVPAALRTLDRIMSDEEASEAARVRAASVVLDRALGKAEAAVDPGAEERVEGPSPLDLRISAALDRLAEVHGIGEAAEVVDAEVVEDQVEADDTH